jgi:SAM-dependent methyltransferase
MLDHALARMPERALDVGCGEGRFCRMLASAGVKTIGVDPTARFIDEARRRDPQGDYRLGCAERLEFGDETFDLAVSYLSLIDIDDAGGAIAEMARVLRPGGRVLVAHLNGFATAMENDVSERFRLRPRRIRAYLDPRPVRTVWKGIDVINWHRPLSYYFETFLGAGLALRRFEEPAPHSGDPRRIRRYRDVPHFCLMEWAKD